MVTTTRALKTNASGSKMEADLRVSRCAYDIILRVYETKVAMAL